MDQFLRALLRSGTVEDLVWALALLIAWCSALRTGEWTIRDGRAIHKPETLYWDSCKRDKGNEELKEGSGHLFRTKRVSFLCVDKYGPCYEQSNIL